MFLFAQNDLLQMIKVAFPSSQELGYDEYELWLMLEDAYKTHVKFSLWNVYVRQRVPDREDNFFKFQQFGVTIFCAEKMHSFKLVFCDRKPKK